MQELVPAVQTIGMKFKSLFTKGGRAFDSVKWVRRDAVIIGGDGREKFRQNDVEVPDWWNDTTINVVAEKYFRVVNGVRETSAKQMFGRVAGWLRIQGLQQGVFATPQDADLFEQELLYMFVNGMHAFNSPVWFNMGVSEKPPQCSACFIQSVDDTMESIMSLAQREVLLFKGGSGTGSNLSYLRSSHEVLSGGGRPSGPVSFMKGYDSFAGVTKSGGTTRRAAKMVVLNVNHPDVLEQRNGEAGFITCKARSEQLAQDLYSTGKYTAEWNKPGNIYDLVSYQNANNSVRVTDDFMQAVEKGGKWQTKEVRTGVPVHTYEAEDIWTEIAKATWICGDPGVQFDTATNDWHTCPNSGRINASNPCSEYLFLDDTACNLSSVNLLRFADGRRFKLDEFVHACSLATVAKEIIVEGSSYPSEQINSMSHKYRTLGLGFTNLGALLTFWGLPYDSNEGRAVAGAISAVMGGAAQRTSAELAQVKGPFSEYEKNKEPMLRVVRKHWDAAKRLPTTIVKEWQPLVEKAYEIWKEALNLGKKYGYRNAQVTVIAPTGTISFLMGADTTGIEPMLGVVVYKKVVGEGLLVLPNGVVEPSLHNLGYSVDQISRILEHIRKTGSIHTAIDFDRSRHGAIFAEALGDYAIKPEAHIDMMGAVQPFISGGISKTVNMPQNCTWEEISSIYMRAWKTGLKCVAIYRDNCKLSQPISTEFTEKSRGSQSKDLAWGQRKKLPETRNAKTHKFDIQGFEGYVNAGTYDDSSLAEIFIRMAKQGSTLNGLLEAWAIAVSVGLQHGVPLETFVDKYQDMKFEPSGFTQNDDIRIAKSIPDYLFRWLDTHFGKGTPEVEEPLVVDLAKHLMTAKNLDGPPCSKCGNLTKRSGSCYCCTQCGTTTGCS